MQGVDRLDQLRARFSIADGHSFKKWHNKLAMSFIDIARVNGYITRKLACPDVTNRRDSHRHFLMMMTRDLLSEAWRSSVNESQMMYAPHSTSSGKKISR
jgi:hypothetical protein